MTEFSTLDDLGRFAQSNPDIVSLDAFVIDVNGNALGKRVPMSDAPKVFESGVAFSACAPLLDCRGRGHDAGGRGASDGDPDGIALPLAGTLVRVPWAKTPTAQVMCVMREYGTQEPLWFDQRVVLEEIVAKCRSHGLHAVIACELEFYLVDSARTPQGHLRIATNPRTGAAPNRPTNLSLESIEDQVALLSQIETAAQAQDIPLGSAVSE